VGRPYLAALRESGERLELERGLLRRELGLLEEAARPRPSLRERGERGERVHRRLFQADEGGLSFTLERYVVEQAARSRVYVEQSDSRVLGPRPDGLVAVQTDVRAVGDFQGVVELLYALENGSRLVHVERLALEPVASAADEGERVSLSLTASGFALAEEAPDSVEAP
jgi:hypothetical protein